MKVNVGLYGGSKNEKSVAEIITCDKCNDCSFYNCGKCLSVKQIFTRDCKFGNKIRTEGYTKRAKKYNEFISQYKSDEAYNKCTYPNSDWRIGVIGDTVVLNLVHIYLDHKHWDRIKYVWKDIEGIEIHDCGLSLDNLSYINKSEFTPELVHMIYSYKPSSMFGGAIESYGKRIVPMFLKELSILCPDVYSAAVEKYPELSEVTVDYRGKYAYINSLRDGIEIKDRNGTFLKRDGKLYCENFNSAFLPFYAKKGLLVLDISDNMKVEITDNAMVDENTVFG